MLGIAQLGTRLGTASGPLGASLPLTGAAVALGVAALLSGTLSGGTPPHAWAPKTMESKRLFGVAALDPRQLLRRDHLERGQDIPSSADRGESPVTLFVGRRSALTIRR